MDTLTIISSYKLGPSELKAAQTLGTKEFGPSNQVVNQVDKSVIAGVKLVSGGKELDLTIQGSLARLGKALS